MSGPHHHENETLALNEAATFYGDSFKNCRLVLAGGNPRFLNCIFIDCEFEPPIKAALLGAWSGYMHGAIIERSRAIPDGAQLGS